MRVESWRSEFTEFEISHRRKPSKTDRFVPFDVCFPLLSGSFVRRRPGVSHRLERTRENGATTSSRRFVDRIRLVDVELGTSSENQPSADRQSTSLHFVSSHSPSGQQPNQQNGLQFDENFFRNQIERIFSFVFVQLRNLLSNWAFLKRKRVDRTSFSSNISNCSFKNSPWRSTKVSSLLSWLFIVQKKLSNELTFRLEFSTFFSKLFSDRSLQRRTWIPICRWSKNRCRRSLAR